MATVLPRRQSLRSAEPPTRVPLGQMELFAGIPERDLELLEGRLGVIRWPRGADMPAALDREDHLFVVRDGRLAVFRRAGAGGQIMIALLETGSVYSTLGAASPPLLAALESSAVSPLSCRAVEGLISCYPRFGCNLARLLSERMEALAETVAMVSEIRVEDRLRERLHQLAERFGVATADGVRLNLDLTHAQWASLVGASREAVTTAFGKLKGQGSVILDGRSILVPWMVVREREAAASAALAEEARELL